MIKNRKCVNCGREWKCETDTPCQCRSLCIFCIVKELDIKNDRLSLVWLTSSDCFRHEDKSTILAALL